MTVPRRALASEPAPPMPHSEMAGALDAVARRRRLFDPDRGWFRRLERETSLWLSRHVFPRVPAMARLYSRQLDRGLVLSEATVMLSGLPPGFEGTRVLLVTDVHAGPFLVPRSLERAFARLLALEPDVVVLGGDFATSRLDDLPPFAAAFRALTAPLGVFGVLGNHDHYVESADRLAATVEGWGIRLLRNAAAELVRGGDRLVLAGVDDLVRGHPDLDRALQGLEEGDRRSPVVVLVSHNPDLFFEAAMRGVALMLSGHTHGGQVRIPALPVLVRQSRYRLDGGRYRFRHSQLVVSRGLGVTGVPLRLGCPPEAVLLTLAADRSPRAADGARSGVSWVRRSP
jgi:predicted MPP superfamily phosphohydrolase